MYINDYKHIYIYNYNSIKYMYISIFIYHPRSDMTNGSEYECILWNVTNFLMVG